MSKYHAINGEVKGSDAMPSDASDSEAGGSGAEEAGADVEEEEAWGARALASLEALRAAGALCDVRLVGGAGAGDGVRAHRAVLAAASPYLLQALAAPGDYRVPAVPGAALAALVRWLYTGRGPAERDVYLAAWRLRAEHVRARLAPRLVRRALAPPAPAPAVLQARDLPDLPPALRARLHRHIAEHFDSMCESGAVSSLPAVTLQLVEAGGARPPPPAPAPCDAEDARPPLDTPDAVAEAALALLRDKMEKELYSLDELCAETLVVVEEEGRLRDLAPASAPRAAPTPPAPAPDAPFLLGWRAPPRGEWVVVAAGAGRALLVLGARGVLLRVRRGARPAGDAAGEARGQLARGRAAHGACALDGRLLVVGGYDRAEALRDAESYDPATNAWSAWGGAGLRAARARFGAARLGGRLFALGGSDGHAELASVEVLEEGGWRTKAALPVARSHAAAAADEERQHLYCVGGWSNGLPLRSVHRYSPATDSWSEMAALQTGRSQCGAAVWAGALWAVGGCDAWHCLSSVERLSVADGEQGAAWAAGPALGAARRAAGLAAWGGALVAAGGSDGVTSLRRTDVLAPGAASWRAGPPLHKPRAALTLSPLGAALYAVGGFSGKEFLPCVETLHSLDGAWTLLRDPPHPHNAPLLLGAPSPAPSPAGPLHDDLKTKLLLAADPEPANTEDTIQNGDHPNGE